MKVSCEKIENSQVVLNIELEPEKVEKGLERAYRKVVNRVNIPGFRKGKAPRYVVERMIGREAIYEEATRELLPAAYREAITQENISPLADPELEIVDFEPLIFKAVVPVPPTVELGDYRSLRLQPEEASVSEETVEAALKAKQEENATWEDPAEERGVQRGDQVILDVEMRQDGELVGEKAETQTIVLGTTPLLPGLEEHLVDAKPGEEREAVMTLPEDYPMREVAGREVTFKMTISSVKEKRLPALDDEFAKSVSDCQTMEDLRQQTRENLLAEAKNQADERFTDLLIRSVADQAQVDMPPVMIEREVERLLQDYNESFKAQHLSLDKYLEAVGKKLEDFREQLRPRAEQRVRNGLVLNAVREAEGITLTEEDINGEIDKVAEGLGETGQRVKEALMAAEARESFATNLLEEKIIKCLKELVTQTEAGEPESQAAAEDLETAGGGDGEAGPGEQVLEAEPVSALGEREEDKVNE